MRFIYLFVVLLLAFGCQSESGQLRQDIKTLEKDASDSSDQRLFQLYNTYLEQFPNDSLYVAAYLRKMAQMEYQSFQYAAALQYAYRGLRDYYAVEEETQATISFLHQVYEQTVASPFLLSVLEAAAGRAFPKTFSDWTDGDQLEEKIRSKQKSVYAELTQYPNMESANELISGSELYALILPASEHTPGFLFAAAEICQGLGVYQRGLGLLDWITSRYPNHPKAAQAAFLKAFVLDEHLRDAENAKRAYQEFLEQYPNDDFADDARMLIEALSE